MDVGAGRPDNPVGSPTASYTASDTAYYMVRRRGNPPQPMDSKDRRTRAIGYCLSEDLLYVS